MQKFFTLRGVFLLFFVFITSYTYAQPANDNPCNAIEIATATSCIFSTYTTVGATATTGVAAPGCASYVGGDVWFAITVPCTGSLSVTTAAGSITNGGMALYSGDCNALLLVTCNDNASGTNLMPAITRSGLIPGETVFIRFWVNGNTMSGTFGICATIQPPAQGGSTCATAQAFCSSNQYTFPNITGQPNTAGGGSFGCLATIPNPVWYFMQIETSGDLHMQISQTSTTGTPIDVDFCLWGPFTSPSNGCAQYSASNIVDCSYSTAAVEYADIIGAVAGQYYLILITNYNGASGTITFNGLPTSTCSTNCNLVCSLTASNNGPVCPGGQVTLTASTVPNAVYNWNGLACNVSTGQTVTITAPTTVGSYNYTVIATQPGGATCSATTTVVVSNSLASGSANAVATNCPGMNNGSITFNPSPPGNYTYILNPGNITQVNNPVFTGLAAGTYSINYSNSGGCSGTLSNITVGEGPALTASATSTATSCPQVTDGTITVTPITGVGPFTYTLNPGNITQSSNVFTGLGAGNYTISFSSSSGCQGAVAGTVTVDAGPPLSAGTSQVDLRCSYTNDGTLTVTPNSGSGPYTFTLTPGNITQTGASNTTFTGLSAYTAYTVNYSDAAGCQGTLNATLTSNPELKVVQNAKAMPLCNGDSNGSIDISAFGGVADYQYSLNSGTNYQGVGLFSNIPAGTYNVRVKDNVGCFKDTVIVLGQPSQLQASATNSKPATCDGNDGEITITGQGGTPPYTYSINDGAFVPNNIYIAPVVGPYPNIKVKDNNGCLNQTSTNVVYINNLVANLGADTAICQGDTLRLFPQITGNANIFRWVPGLMVLDVNVKDGVMFPIDTTVYKLIIQQGPCSAEDEIKVNVKWKPKALAGADTTICFNDKAVLNGGVSHNSGTVLYNWVPTRNLLNADTSYTIFTPVRDTVGTFIYTLHVKDDYGCGFEVTDQKKITVRPAVPAFAGKDTLGVKGLPHKLLGSGGKYYEWSPPLPLNNPFAAQPFATIYDDTKFYMKTTDEFGCVGYDTVLVKVYEGPTYYIPNAFSPNGDGLNDIFRVIPVGIARTDYFRIFDRWGNLVFSNKEFLKGWDGTYKGQKVPLGHYVWMIRGVDRDGKVIERTGTVMVVQ